MRRLTISILAAIGCTVSAHAADLDYDMLRGADYEPVAVPLVDWGGVYAGGHGGYSSAALGFSNAFRSIVANALRASDTEQYFVASSLLNPQPFRGESGSFGALLGYNLQLDNVVVGIEFDYTHSNIGGKTQDEISRYQNSADGYYRAVYLAGKSSTAIQDYGTIRARVGYAFDSFLPFVTGGVAIGRAQVRDIATIQAYGYNQKVYNANQALTDGTKPSVVDYYGYYYTSSFDPGSAVPLPPDSTGRAKTKTVAGFSFGTGLEYAMTSNVILRGEYQYVMFNAFENHKANINTVRGGATLKF